MPINPIFSYSSANLIYDGEHRGDVVVVLLIEFKFDVIKGSVYMLFLFDFFTLDNVNGDLER